MIEAELIISISARSHNVLIDRVTDVASATRFFDPLLGYEKVDGGWRLSMMAEYPDRTELEEDVEKINKFEWASCELIQSEEVNNV